MGLSTFGAVWRTVTILVLSVAVSACVPGLGGPDDDDASGGAGTTTTTDSTPPLEFVGGVSEIYCDNSDRVVGEIRGAEPGEKIELSSPTPLQLSAEQLEATADVEGAYQLTWNCTPSQAGQPWDLHVVGEDSGRQVTVSFIGTTIDPDLVGLLDVNLPEDSFVCNGRSAVAAELSNAAPLEKVTFTSSRNNDVVNDTADDEGHLTFMWHCSPGEAARWQVTARGLQSSRVGEFTIVGVAPPPKEIPTPTVQIGENPFVCDGGSRVFASLSGFLPGEVVDFDSPQASTLADGQADDSGALPLRWTCGAADAATVWELTAIGTQSRRTVTFTVTGAAAPPAPDPTVTTTENPFRCDDTTRFFATIVGFTPREYVDFTSPQVENLRQGQADETGTLQVRWTCGAGDVDRTWDITATGASSKGSVSFQITGAAP